MTGPGGIESFNYDDDGRLANTSRNSETSSFGYATDGKLTSVATTGGTVTYGYDALGRRVRAGDSTGSRRILVAPTAQGSEAQPHLITGASGAVLAGYVYAGDEPLLRFGDGGETFYLTDAMGSVIGLADASGAVIARFEYSAFGETRSASDSPSSPAAGDFRFHASWFDASTGIYRMGERDYDPRTGRFLTRDPFGPQLERPESTNPYLFAHANPLLYEDPSGLFSIMSVNISLSTRGILSAVRTLALNHIRALAREEILKAVGKIILNRLVPFLPIDLGNIAKGALDLADEVGEYKDFWKRAEVGVMRGVCWILQGSEWIYFEPRVETTSGEITHDGFGCPPEGKTRRGPSAGGRFPDFYISTELPSNNSGGLILGEIKASVEIAYHDWVRQRTGSRFRPEQLEAFSRHTAKFITPRLMVLVAFNEGRNTQTMQLAILQKMQQNGLVAGIIVNLR